jgi:hypothetical protein
MIKLRGVLVALTVIAAGIGCGDKATAPNPPPPPPPPPPPGSAVVSLATPNADDGAVIVTLQGPGLSTIQSSATAYVLYARVASAQEARVILVGDLAAGPLFTFKLGAGQAVSAYTASVQQVATRGDALRTSTTGYQLTVAAAP